MHTFFTKITLWKQGVRIIHRSVILPFRNHTSFITGESITESKQQQRTMDALQFNIKQVIKVKQSKCYTICHRVRRLETPKLKKCQNHFQEAQPAHQYLPASCCSHCIQHHHHGGHKSRYISEKSGCALYISL